jgi:hypothetical protein
LTAQGHPRAIFHRAIERGNLAVAETTLRAEIPRQTLVDLLELTALIALKEPQRHPRVADPPVAALACSSSVRNDLRPALAASLLQALAGPP